MDAKPGGIADFSLRTRIVQGSGTAVLVGKLASELGRRRALIVTDPGIVAAGHVGRAQAALRESGVESSVFDGAHENPTTDDVERALKAARAFAPDLLIGLGGGSSLDTAKGCNFLLAGGGRMEDYWGTGKGRGTFLPMFAVPTTGGTGSEMQSYALISQAEGHTKMACGDVRAACAIAILDPDLTLTQPSQVTALTGMDAISHAVETWVCTRRNSVSAVFSRQAFQLLAGAFPVVLAEPGNLAARADMQLGAALAGLAIENSMLGGAHALANPLTARFDIAHGQAIAITLPLIVRFNGEAVAADYFSLLQAVFGPANDELASQHRLADLIVQWRQQAGLHSTLAELGVDKKAIPAMSEEAARQWTAGFNPRKLDAAAAEMLYRQAF